MSLRLIWAFGGMPCRKGARKMHHSPALTGKHIVFSCAGIEREAMVMRRCTQIAIGIELLGSQCAKFFFSTVDFSSFHSVAEQGIVMNNFIMLLHCGAMWWYQCYTRDHILARHVTAVSLDKSIGATQLGEPLIAYIETRPWTHRLKLEPRSRDEILSLGRLSELGAIQIDQRRGEVHDPIALELLLDDVFEITSEQITVDDEAKKLSWVGDYEVTELLQEDTDGMYQRLASLPSLIKKPLQWDGRYAYWNFCVISLAMGIGSVILFLPEGTIPWPQLFEPRPSRKFEW